MAPEATPQVNDQVTDPANGPKQDPPASSAGTGDQQQVTAPVIDDSTQLPDTHPLMVKHAELKAKLSTANTELAEARTTSAKATQLEEELGKRPTTEALGTLQTRYDRLEEFLVAAGGPLGRALDSRTFTKDLFETDKPVADLVKSFLRANPSATSAALGGGSNGGQGGSDKKDPNELIRIAARK